MDGVYHLFYQHNPNSNNWGSLHWGHATSRDLIHWEEKDVALYPDELGMVFSGSAIVDENNDSGFFPDGKGLIAFYTSYRERDPLPGFQQQCMAFSSDGEHWTPYASNPVIPNPGYKEFRDPKVFFHQESRAWILVLAAGPRVLFYRSRNLIDWEFASEFGRFQRDETLFWECPDFIPMRSDKGRVHWVLFVSNQSRRSFDFPQMQFFVGVFDGYRFEDYIVEKEVQIVDYGPDFYGAQSWYGTEKRTWIGWMSHWAYSHMVPTSPWRGIMSIPRNLELEEDGDTHVLIQQPVEALLQAHGEAVEVRDMKTFQLPSSSCDILITLDRPFTGRFRMEFVTKSQDRLLVQWEGSTRILTIARRGLVGNGFHPKFDQDIEIPVQLNGPLTIRLIVDHSTLEFFINGGRQVATCQVFPESEFFQLIHDHSSGIALRSLIYYPLS